MTIKSAYYRPSGVMTAHGVGLAVLFGATVSLIAGAVYGYAIFYIPFIYLNSLGTIGYGWLVGTAIALAARYGKIRNPAAMTFVACLFGLLADYTGWIGWIFAASEQSVLILTPTAILELMREVASEGSWSIFGWTPRGLALYGIWAIELLLISATATITTWSTLSPLAFCEACGRWAVNLETSPRFSPVEDIESTRSHIEQGDYRDITELEPAGETAAVFSQFEVAGCPSCDQQRYVSGKNVEITEDSKGNETRSETEVFQNLVLPREVLDEVAKKWYPSVAT